MVLLCAVGLFNLVDRQVMTILLEPIKQEFGASDTAMGLLTGSVFALFIIAIAAAEVGVGLAIVLLIYRNRRSVDLDDVAEMKG